MPAVRWSASLNNAIAVNETERKGSVLKGILTKKRLWAWLLCLALLCPCISVQAVVQEPSSWAKAEVEDALALGIVPEALNGKFQSAVTREEFCTLAVKTLEVFYGMTGEALCQQREVQIDEEFFADTACREILITTALGITVGRGQDEESGKAIFMPDAQITRAEAARMLWLVGKILENGVKSQYLTDVFGEAEPLPFRDSYMPSWAEEGVDYGYKRI